MFIASGETPHLLARYVVTLTQHLQRLQEPCCRVSAARQGTDASPTNLGGFIPSSFVGVRQPTLGSEPILPLFTWQWVSVGWRCAGLAEKLFSPKGVVKTAPRFHPTPLW